VPIPREGPKGPTTTAASSMSEGGGLVLQLLLQACDLSLGLAQLL
jgi:hypothetical protein